MAILTHTHWLCIFFILTIDDIIKFHSKYAIFLAFQPHSIEIKEVDSSIASSSNRCGCIRCYPDAQNFTKKTLDFIWNFLQNFPIFRLDFHTKCNLILRLVAQISGKITWLAFHYKHKSAIIHWANISNTWKEFISEWIFKHFSMDYQTHWMANVAEKRGKHVFFLVWFHSISAISVSSKYEKFDYRIFSSTMHSMLIWILWTCHRMNWKHFSCVFFFCWIYFCAFRL